MQTHANVYMIFLACLLLQSFSAFADSVVAQSDAAHTSAHASTDKVDTVKGMASKIHITDAWARATFSLAKTGAAYLSINNPTKDDMILSAISVSEDVAMMAEIHHTVMQDGMMSMQELADGVEIKAGNTVSFVPGGKHFMLMGLTGPLENGKTLTINLHFKDGSTLPYELPITDSPISTH